MSGRQEDADDFNQNARAGRKRNLVASSSSDDASDDSARSPRKRGKSSSGTSRSPSREWEGTLKFSAQPSSLYTDAHQQAEHVGMEKHRRALPPNVPAKSFSKTDDTQVKEQDTDGNCCAVSRFVPTLNLDKQKTQCLIVSSLPTTKHAPRLSGIRKVAQVLGLSEDTHTEPFRKGYDPPHEQYLLTYRISQMLSDNGWENKFDCSKFTYDSTHDTIAIGLAVGRPARTQNTLLAKFLLLTKRDASQLDAIVGSNIPPRYSNLAVEYVRQRHLNKPQSKLDYDQNSFVGITIFSEPLPPLSNDQYVSICKRATFTKSEEVQIVNSSAQSKSRSKANLNPRDSKRPRPQLMPPRTPPASSRGRPMPPPPPFRVDDSTGNTFARTPHLRMCLFHPRLPLEKSAVSVMLPTLPHVGPLLSEPAGPGATTSTTRNTVDLQAGGRTNCLLRAHEGDFSPEH